MQDSTDLNPIPVKRSWIAIAAGYLAILAVVARTLTSKYTGDSLTEYIVPELVFIILSSIFFLRTTWPVWLLHLYFAFQSILTLRMIAIEPEFDFVTLFFLLLSYQAALIFTGRVRWLWAAIFVLLTGGSLIYYMGPWRGLAISLTNMAGIILITAYLIVNQETEKARAKSQALLDDLQATNQQLASYASQVEELATMQERNRLARKLHDGVSQLIFGITLMTRSTQLLLERDPGQVAEHLTALQEITSESLSQLRSLITQLRPPQKV